MNKFFSIGLSTACLLLMSASTNMSAQGIVSCPADGRTDATTCLQNALSAAGSAANRQVFLGSGTFLVSRTIVIPNKVQVLGVGRGDPGINTVVKASRSFPSGQAVVQMGFAPGPNFNVQISNLTIDGSALAGTCLTNLYSEELSWGRNLMLTGCTNGLTVATSVAQNSGPFEDLEIYPYNSNSALTSCFALNNVPAFRGLRDFTCNGAAMGQAQSAALLLNGAGSYSNFHVEHFAVGASLGSFGVPADGLMLSAAHFGPGVTTGVQVNSGYSNQNLTFLALACDGCTNLLNDQIMGTQIPDSTLGFYMIGNGGSNAKNFVNSKIGLGTNFFGRVQASNGITLGPGNPRNDTTLSIYDSTPNTGVTSVQEVAGAGQGGIDLHEWRDPYNNLITSIGGNGALRSSMLQLMPDWTASPCNSSVRGTFYFMPSPSGTQDHVHICAKLANDSYSWLPLF